MFEEGGREKCVDNLIDEQSQAEGLDDHHHLEEG